MSQFSAGDLVRIGFATAYGVFRVVGPIRQGGNGYYSRVQIKLVSLRNPSHIEWIHPSAIIPLSPLEQLAAAGDRPISEVSFDERFALDAQTD